VAHEQAAIAKGDRGGAARGRRNSSSCSARLPLRTGANGHSGSGRGRWAGTVEHFGMPVDPGNLLLMGARGAASRCSARPAAHARRRRTALTGLLMRLLARRPGAARDHRGHGRRWAADGDRHPAAARATSRLSPGITSPRIVLGGGALDPHGAGRTSFLAEIGGRPAGFALLVEQALASRAKPVIVVTGHERERVESGRSKACRCSSCTILIFCRRASAAPVAPPALRRWPAAADGAIVCPGRHGRRSMLH